MNNQYDTGTLPGHTYKGRLSESDVAELVAQQTALQGLKGNPAIVPLLRGIGARLRKHDTAVTLAALNQDAIRRRNAILASVKAAMIRYEDAGWNYPLTLTLNHDGTVVQPMGLV